jgi:hypothetical protein
MQCYECSLTTGAREAVGICHHCSAGLCADHASMVEDPVIAHLPVAREVVLPKVARLLLCRTCKMALEQPHVENVE